MISKLRGLPLAACAFAALFVAGSAQANTISLMSNMDPNTGLSEDAVTGSIAQIGFGSGSKFDADGLYNISNPAIQFSSLDVFPEETAFNIGLADFDGPSVSGTGIETVAINSIDLSALWTSGSSTTDISDTALDLWFFASPNSLTFGALDASDTLTFTNGVLTSIDLSVTATYSLFDAGANLISYDGTFSISGSTLDLAISDTENFDTGIFGVLPSTFTSDLTGTVKSVGLYAVPEPGTGLLLGAGLALLGVRRRES